MVDILQLCADGWQVLSDRVELARGNRAPIGLMVAHEIFIHKPTLLAVINAEIDAKADDKNALTPEARQLQRGAIGIAARRT